MSTLAGQNRQRINKLTAILRKNRQIQMARIVQ
jgi:hypothetical protein